MSKNMSVEPSRAAPTDVVRLAADDGRRRWGPGGTEVVKAMRGLTKTERMYVRDGSLHGDIRMTTVRSLKRKAMFYLKITSPNGRCGEMVLTPLGENVRALLRPAAGQPASGEARDGSSPKSDLPHPTEGER